MIVSIKIMYQDFDFAARSAIPVSQNGTDIYKEVITCI